jgi:TonB family protein
MLRLWAHSYANTAFVPSAALSVAAHVACLGAAVIGVERRAQELRVEMSSRVFYMPPPDRVPRSDVSMERLQFVELGAGVLDMTATAAHGTPAGMPPPDELRGGGSRGNDALQQLPTPSIASPDSVYSVLTVEESAVRSEASAAPAYPREMLEQGMDGRVLTRYVIDTTGHADSASFVVLRATHPAFVQAVREALPGMRFSPAVVAGYKVRQLVEQNFEFHVTPPVAAPAEHTRARSPAP